MTKDKLKQIITLNKIIESKLRQLDDLKATLYGLKSIMSDVTGVRGASISNPTENAAVRIISLSEEINQDIDRLVDLRNEVVTRINQLDVKYRLIIELRYLEGLSWGEIERVLGRTRQHVYRLHGEALAMLQNNT